MQELDVLQVVKIYEQKVWIESDLMGNKHVMVRHDNEKFEPFCFCSFNYDYRYTSNGSIHKMAVEMAIRLGATEPVRVEHRRPCFDGVKPKTQA